MKIIKYSDARTNLRKEIDRVVNDRETTCIVSKNNQFVMMSKSDYDTMVETFQRANKLRTIA